MIGAVQLATPGFEALADVLADAFNQASVGKGQERHGQGAAFDMQPMQRLIDLYGPGFALGQAAKKSQESLRMPPDRARAELLGAIVYIAGAIIALDRGAEALAANDNRGRMLTCQHAHGCRHLAEARCIHAGACQA